MPSITQYDFWDDSALPILKKAYLSAANIWYVKLDVSSTETLYKVDLIDTPDGYFQSPSGLGAGLYAAVVNGDEKSVQIAAHHSGGYDINVDVDPMGSYPRYVYVADDQTQTEESGVPTVPNWIITADSPYSEKQEYPVAAIKNNWRAEKHRWLTEAVAYSDVHENLMKYLGLFLNRAEQCIYSVFRDPDIDPLLVAKFVNEISRSAVGIDTIEALAKFINSYIQAGITPSSTHARTWVKFEGSGASRTVVRLTPAQVLADEGYQTPLIANFNSIDSDWIVANQVGEVTATPDNPVVGGVVAAALTDPDGVVSNTEIWQWKKETETVGVFEAITGATANTYTVAAPIVAGDVICATVTYTDNYGPNQVAQSNTVTVA